MTVLALPPDPPVGALVIGDLFGRSIRYTHRERPDFPGDPLRWEFRHLGVSGAETGWVTWANVLAAHPDGVTLVTPPPVGEPSRDRVGTVRVHPDDNPNDPGARRRIRVDTVGDMPWRPITGYVTGARSEYDAEVAGWQVQDLIDLGRVLGHDGYTGEDPRERLAGVDWMLRRALGASDDTPLGEMLVEVKRLRRDDVALAEMARKYSSRVDRATAILAGWQDPS